jgi:hypothetical protein
MIRDTSWTVKDNRRMKLEGQGELGLRERSRGEAGYAMATLLVAMSLMAVFMTVALPAWTQMAQRDKEEEYLFRANQYALAVARCRAKHCGANGFAPSVDFLIEQKYLRKKYKDPLTGKDFVVVFNNQAIPGQAQQAGQAGLTVGVPSSGQLGQTQKPQQQSSLATAKSLATDTLRITTSESGTDGARPLTGVTSSSKATGLRLFKGQETTYDQWAVTADDVNLHLGGRSVGSRFAATQVAQGAAQQGGQRPGQQQGQPNPFSSGNTSPQPLGSPGGFGNPGSQGQPVFPPSPFGGPAPGGQAPGGQKPPVGASPFGTVKPPS